MMTPRDRALRRGSGLNGGMEARQYRELVELLSDAQDCHRLTQWEQEFIDSMQQRVDAMGNRIQISTKQDEILNRIKVIVYAT